MGNWAWNIFYGRGKREWPNGVSDHGNFFKRKEKKSGGEVGIGFPHSFSLFRRPTACLPRVMGQVVRVRPGVEPQVVVVMSG